MNRETAIAIATVLAVFLAQFIGTLYVVIRQHGVRKDVNKMKNELPAQVETQVSGPLGKVSEQMAEYVKAGDYYRDQMQALIADKDAQHERTLVELEKARQALRISEQTAIDLKQLVNDTLKERTADFDRLRKLQTELDSMRKTQEAQLAGSRARDAKIQQLTADLAAARRELTTAQSTLVDTQKQLDTIRTDRETVRTEREDLRQELEAERAKTTTLQEQVKQLMEKVASLEAQLAARDAADAGAQARQAFAGVVKAAADAQPASEAH